MLLPLLLHWLFFSILAGRLPPGLEKIEPVKHYRQQLKNRLWQFIQLNIPMPGMFFLLLTLTNGDRLGEWRQSVASLLKLGSILCLSRLSSKWLTQALIQHGALTAPSL